MNSEAIESKDNADDLRLAALARSGDSTALTALLEKYSQSVGKRAASYRCLSGLETDDLYQEGMMGLLSAVYSYDSGRGASFAAYSSLVVNRKILSAVRSANSQKNLPMREYVSIEDTDLLSAMPTPEEALLHSEELGAVNSFIKNGLSKNEQKVLKLYLHGLSYTEIADILDCGDKSVDNAMQRIRRKLRDFKLK